MYLMIACMYYEPNRGFTANDALFYKNKVGYLLDMLQFQLIVYAIIKITYLFMSLLSSSQKKKTN